VRRLHRPLVSAASVTFCQGINVSLLTMKPAVAFIALLASFLLIARHFGVTIQPTAGVSVALLLAPYWAFGFGFDNWLRTHLTNKWIQVVTPQLLIAAYLVYAVPSGQFLWSICLGMSAILLAITLLLQHANAPPDWHDILVLALLGISVDLHFFDR